MQMIFNPADRERYAAETANGAAYVFIESGPSI
jgi:hypothetical protein